MGGCGIAEVRTGHTACPLNQESVTNQVCGCRVCEEGPGPLSVMTKWFLPFSRIDESRGVTGLEAIPVKY